MPQLAAVYSTYLQELLSQKKDSLDAVELTPWQPFPSLPKILPGLADYELYFHGSNLTARTLFLPGERSRLADTLRLTRPKWFSTHISFLPPGWVWLALRFDIHLPAPPIEWMLSGYIRDVKRLKAEHGDIPLLLENMPVEPRRIYKQFKSPKIIREVIEKTDCGLLLDLPHARIAAEAFGMEATDYIQQLPLDRVVEIHTSGPRRRSDGILIDQHAVMQAEDYDLLQWALAHTPVKLVTLEYFKDRNGLESQLSELSHLVGTTRPGRI
jgi:uncharacterized protein (UPF0276 family)